MRNCSWNAVVRKPTIRDVVAARCTVRCIMLHGHLEQPLLVTLTKGCTCDCNSTPPSALHGPGPARSINSRTQARCQHLDHEVLLPERRGVAKVMYRFTDFADQLESILLGYGDHGESPWRPRMHVCAGPQLLPDPLARASRLRHLRLP